MKHTQIIFCILAIFTTQMYAQCPANCTCANGTTCSGCSLNGYYLNTNANTCTACSSNCGSCTSGNDCTSCNSINGSASYFDSITTSCRTCSQLWTTCESCTNLGCTQRCKTGDEWKDGSCQDTSFWSWANFWKLFTAFLLPCCLLCCLLALLAMLCRPKKPTIIQEAAPVQIEQIIEQPVQTIIQTPPRQIQTVQRPAQIQRVVKQQPIVIQRPPQVQIHQQRQVIQRPAVQNVVNRQVVANDMQYFRKSDLYNSPTSNSPYNYYK